MERNRIGEFGDARRLQLLIDAVIDYAIFQLDPSGRISSWNSGAQRAKGYLAEDIIGKHFSCFYTAEDQEAGVPAKALRTATEVGRYEAEGWRCRKDGTRFWASVVIDRIIDEDGSLVGFAKVTRDITERREAQRALAEAQEQLAASQKMEAIGQLSGGIAHDFNNLLMIVIGNLETAQRNVREGNAANLQRAIASAMRGAQRAAALTSRLLAFSRRQALNPKPLDIDRFLAGSAEFLQRTLGETISVEAVSTPGVWPVEVDHNHLEIALVNLAVNARDAMPSGGKFTLAAANVQLDQDFCRTTPELTPGPFVMISVTDTGTGMPPDVLSRAFEPFFTTKELGQGTGLGLSQVYGFVKQSGGHIKILSEPDHGTTINIYLPRLAAAPLAEVADESGIGESEKGEAILVVEDDDDLRTYICDLLRELKYSVIGTADAAAALSVLRTGRRVDLLLTDIVMPGRNGKELALAATQLRPSLRILFMTGYARNAVAQGGRIEEGIDLIQKPVTQSDLSTRVRDALERAADGAPLH